MASLETMKKVAKISRITGFTNLCYKLNKNRKRTIAYHSIIPDKYWDNTLHLDYSMKESSFIKQVEIIENRLGCTPDIDDWSKATITFDDGYKNQYSVASKILDERNIQGYFFCATNVIRNNEAFIMDKLQYWCSYVPYGIYNLKKVNIRLDINDEQCRKTEWVKVSDAILEGVEIERIERMLDSLYPFERIKMDKDFYKLRFKGISKEELNKMKSKGHKIGAHSANHKRLSDMSSKELHEDISLCSSMLSEIYNTEVFCYPFGSVRDINEEVVEILKDSGFNSSFAFSNNHIKEGYDKYFMPRMFLPDTDDKDIIDLILSGAKHFMSFRKLLPKY